MSKQNNFNERYNGFEQGPIRPPSESYSLLVRVTRNCPWNHCTFCPVYKGKPFSLRPIEHIIRDINSISKHINIIKDKFDDSKEISQENINLLSDSIIKDKPDDIDAFNASISWYFGGAESIFIQDANSLIIKPADLIKILTHLKKCFPWVKRITSYARSHTVSRIKINDLVEMRNAGLSRIHIGLESGSDQVLEMVKKGVTKKDHIKAGLKIKEAKIELSEYVMPGLGGKTLSKIHARQTADALNQINPDFIRLRSLAIPGNIPLFNDLKNKKFIKCTDYETAVEILTFLENLNGITSKLRSDHILNLFQEVEGTFPDDKENMCNIIRNFISMDKKDQCIYQVGRRFGIFLNLQELNNKAKRSQVETLCKNYGIDEQNVDKVIEEVITRYI